MVERGQHGHSDQSDATQLSIVVSIKSFNQFVTLLWDWTEQASVRIQHASISPGCPVYQLSFHGPLLVGSDHC